MNGVAFYDDSKATNTGAVLSALMQFAGNVILIAGGRDKGDDYGLLRAAVGEKVKRLVLIGEAAGQDRGQAAGCSGDCPRRVHGGGGGVGGQGGTTRRYGAAFSRLFQL